MEQDRDNLQEGIRAALNEAGLLNSEIGIVGDAVEVTLPSEDEADRARDVINSLQQGLAITSPADNRLRVVLTDAALRDRTNSAMSPSVWVMRRRIDEAGAREASIQRQGTERHVIQVHAFTDTQRHRAVHARQER